MTFAATLAVVCGLLLRVTDAQDINGSNRCFGMSCKELICVLGASVGFIFIVCGSVVMRQAFRRRPSESDIGPVLTEFGIGLPPVRPSAVSEASAFPSEIRLVSQQSVHWMISTDPYVFWRHPIARISGAFSVLVMDMYLYGEDPVNDSHVEANIPGIGHLLSLLAFPLAPTAGTAMLRLVLALISIFLGLFVGRQFVHGVVLRDFCKMSMFQERDGSICVMVVTCVVTLLIGSMAHNVLVGFSDTLSISSAMGFQMRHFGKIAQSCSVTADLIAFSMITDSVLQDKRRYPEWAPRVKQFWTDTFGGSVRIVTVWLGTVGTVALLAWAIFSTGKDAEDFTWDNRRFGGLTEVTRSLLVSCIIFADLLTVVQDWDFPTFKEPLDLRGESQESLVAGLWVPELRSTPLHGMAQRCCLPELLGHSWLTRQLPSADFFHFSIKGKWIMYGPLLVIMCLDFLSVRLQIFYDPILYGQYVDPADNRIWTIVDSAYLLEAYDRGVVIRPELISYEARRDATTGAPLSESAALDVLLNSRHLGSDAKVVGLVLGLLWIGIFLALVRSGDRRRKAIAWFSAQSESSLPLGQVASEVEVGEDTLEEGHKIPAMLDMPVLDLPAVLLHDLEVEPVPVQQMVSSTTWKSWTSCSLLSALETEAAAVSEAAEKAAAAEKAKLEELEPHDSAAAMSECGSPFCSEASLVPASEGTLLHEGSFTAITVGPLRPEVRKASVIDSVQVVPPGSGEGHCTFLWSGALCAQQPCIQASCFAETQE